MGAVDLVLVLVLCHYEYLVLSSPLRTDTDLGCITNLDVSWLILLDFSSRGDTAEILMVNASTLCSKLSHSLQKNDRLPRALQIPKQVMLFTPYDHSTYSHFQYLSFARDQTASTHSLTVCLTPGTLFGQNHGLLEHTFQPSQDFEASCC